MEVDTTTEFGRRVMRRLEEEQVIWLTTVDASNTPQPRPVWFLWEGETILIYSQPGAAKVRHIQRNSRVALHFNGTERGGDIIVFVGTAWIAEGAPAGDENAAYLDKYRPGIERLGSTPYSFARDYSVPIRVEPVKVRGH